MKKDADADTVRIGGSVDADMIGRDNPGSIMAPGCKAIPKYT